MAMLPLASEAQNCASFLSNRKPENHYRYNNASKSATVWSGKKYEFVLPLTSDNEYRIRFYAAPVFNNDIQVKIVDLNTGETVIDLPGTAEQVKKGKVCLADYTDPKTNKLVHPYFDFVPSQATSLKIMIDVKDHIDYMEEPIYDEDGMQLYEDDGITPKVKKSPVIPEGGIEQVKGCFTVYVTDKPADTESAF